MATTIKKYQINQKQSDSDMLVLHPETDASVTLYDNAASQLEATDVKGALDEIADKLKGVEDGVVTGVKGNNETAYRKGDVNLTPAQIGAEPGGAVNTHNTSSTAHSDIRTAISNAQSKADSAYTLAEGRAKAVSFETAAAMTTALKAAAKTEYKVGDNLFIKEMNVPDYWVSAVLDSNAGTYGYFEISPLESQKVDLSEYQKKTDTGLQTSDKTVVGAINEVKGQAASAQSTATAAQTAANTNAAEITKIKDGTTKVPKAAASDKLSTPRAIGLTGDVTGSGNFDGSANMNISAALSNTGVAAGTYSVVTVDTKGRAKAGGQIVEVGAAGQDAPSAALAVGGLFFKEV